MESRWEFSTDDDQLHIDALITKQGEGVFEMSWDVRKNSPEGTILDQDTKQFESREAAELHFGTTAAKVALEPSRIIFRPIDS